MRPREDRSEGRLRRPVQNPEIIVDIVKAEVIINHAGTGHCITAGNKNKCSK